MAKHYDYLIVGAGLYGAVFAREMTDAGKKCLVVERRNHIAGNIYTEDVEGIAVHKYGAHIFHTSEDEVWEYVNRFAKFKTFINSPMARYKNELYNLPFNMNTFTKLWNDVFTPDDAKKRIEEEKKAGYVENPQNLEEQAINLVGKTIYEKLVKGYTEKQWGRECKDLPAFIIRRLPVRFTFDNNYFNDDYQGIPEEGYTAFVEKLLDGIEVRLGVDFLQNKDELCALADKVLYTGAIDEYYAYAFGALEYRSVRFETEIMDGDFQGNAVVNYTEAEVPFTRIIEHKHFGKKTFDKTVVSREYPENWVLGMDAYYPVNDKKNAELYEKYVALAEKEEKLLFGGRLGLYKYYDMDDTVLMALKAVKKELASF
ncbi:MAG: UDP-galactopyranose mutase [Clostridia bacterium]|nr:UDP-galactopyranose mutase [Clostridia bacterium]